MPVEFESASKVFCPHHPEERKNATITCHFGFVFEKNWVGKSHDYHEVIVFKMLGFHNVFCPHENEKPHFHSL